jgi:glycosyltransferase involved in cell wall biosynthesis
LSEHKPQPAVLILNQMAGPITWELAEDMGDALGHVALLTGHPDTLQKSHPQVQMFPAAPYQRGSFPRRALSWVHYWLQAFFWLWRWPKETPLLLFTNPPLLCWLGWLMRVLRGTPYSVMVHDIYPDILVRMSGFSEKHLLIRLWRWLNRRAYERADVVMTLGEYMAATLAQQFDPAQTRQGKIEVIYPWVDTDKIKPIPKAENWFAQKYDQVDKLTVMYSGNMGLGHDIETMLEAARHLQDTLNIHFMFIGAGPKWQMAFDAQQKEGLQNITVLGWQPEEFLPFSLAIADVAVVSLDKGMEGLAVPSKSIYGMAVGSFILATVSQNNELASWLPRLQCGLVVEPGDLEAFLIAIQLALDTWKKDRTLGQTVSRQVATTRFSRKSNTTWITSLFK